MTKTLKIRFAFLGFLLLAGIFVRFDGLATQFSHVDDTGVAKTILSYKKFPVASEWQNWTCVSRHWTYAPAQFFLTFLLTDKEQTYRELLFWGRFPSFLFSILGLGLWILFYKKYDKLKTPAVSVGLVLLVFSWENIIYAKHMGSYAICIFSAIGALLSLWYQISRAPSLKLRVGGAAVLVLLAHTQYQILFLSPAYFLALFVYDWRQEKEKKNAFINLIFPGIVFAAGIYPMYLAFIERQSATAGATWNVGPNKEFLLTFSSEAGLLGNLMNTVLFFIRNGFLAFAVMIGFLPENSPLFFPVSLLFFAVFLTGIYSIVKSPVFRKKLIGVYFLGIAAVWIYFVLRGKLALSPTRHSLILLPYMAYLVAEGWLFILGKLHRLEKAPYARYATWPLLVSIIVLFFAHYPEQVRKWKDPFDEDKLVKILGHFQVDAIVSTGFTWHPALMPKLLANHSYFEAENMDQPYTPRTNPPFQTVAFISQRDKLSKKNFDQMQFKINLFQKIYKRPQFMTGNSESYQPIYAEEISSDVEMEASTRTKNGTNSYYFYVLRKV